MPDLSLETQGFFPQRGRQWRAWEDEFLKTFAAEFGLKISAETLRRPPQDVALRISWLGVKMPAGKVQAGALPKEAPKLKAVPAAWPRAKAEAPEGWKTCAQVAEMAGCSVHKVYGAIWRKKLDALQGARGVWLVPDEAAGEFARKGAAEAPSEGDCDSSILDMVEPAPQSGAEIIPAPPLPDEPPAEARRHAACEAVPVKGPSPQAPDLASMSKLDILKALASGRMVGGCRV